MNNDIVFKIVERDTDKMVEAYSRSNDAGFAFTSPEKAREANIHGVFKDKTKYKINKYRIIYELIENDCDTECYLNGIKTFGSSCSRNNLCEFPKCLK